MSDTLIAFGGAAPLHAARLARKLGMKKIIVPVGAGVGSAFGFLRAPIAYEVVRTRHLRLDLFDAKTVNGLFSAMREEAEAVVRRAAPGETLVETRHAFMRYRGQGHEIAVPLPNRALDADAAFALGLVTANPDDIDWADETRIAIEERVSMSPDALTGMEANLRFNGPENMFTRVFGRLTAWQNWIFQRPNAVGEKGALKVYGKGEKAAFDWNRV